MKIATYALAIGLLGTAGAAQAAETLTIGAIYLDAQGFYAGVRKGVQVEGAKVGRDISIIETNAQGDVSKESSFIDTLVSARVSAIILSAVSADGSVAAVRRASKAGIPVICYNTCINPDDMRKYVAAYAVGDPFTFGEKLGGVAADYFVKAGNTAPKFAVLNCEFVEVCVQRRKGFEKALHDKVPGYTIVSNQEGTILDKAISVAQNIISANGDVDAFFGESGGATLGAAKAVRNQGRIGRTVVFGGDMTTDIAQEIVDGAVIKGEVDVSGQAIGAVALDSAVDAIKGHKADGIVVPVPIVLYTSADQAKSWIEAHKDGLP